jgi:hypothetical protein
MSKRLAPYGQENYAGNLAAISEIIKSRRLHPHGSVAAIGINKSARLLPSGDEKLAGTIAAVGDPKSRQAEAGKSDAPRRRLVRLKAKAG